jgi:serine/threonine protein kinase
MPIDVATQSELIPGYRLLERLGEGGFGEVWKAEAPGGLLKAVKIISGCLQGNGEDEGRLRQELKALNRVRTVRHPFILSLERFEIVDGRLVIVMELADRSLWDRFKECRAQGLPGIPRDELLRYMEETAEALDVMNVQYDLQHLDIKPQNLFLLYNHIKVGDFGLVKDLEGMTARATCGVTAVYAAPETFGGVVSRYCDQYNLAVAYQELLTGRLPFEGANSRQLMMLHVMGEPNLKALPPGDRPAVARALAKMPEDRHPTCTAFVQALRQAGAPAAAGDGVRVAPAAPAGDAGDGPARATPATQVFRPEPREAPRVLVDTDDRPPSATPARHSPPPPAGARETVPNLASRKSTPRFTAAVKPLPPQERPETTGTGVLFPALVVGLGGLGGQVLQQLRKAQRKRGPSVTWPHIRLLHLDTDPEAAGPAAPGEPDAVLAPEEVVLARFQRPSHYLKRQKERQELEEWLPLATLMRLPREQVTAAGWRALGRLAFISAYPAISARLREELEACTVPAALTAAEQRTGLGLRTTRPRCYVVTSLAGGTGGGMFLDVAYALRRLLYQLGYPRAEVVGLLLLPGLDRGAESARAVANAFAALTELEHFADPGVVFSSSGVDGDSGPAGPTPPFSRCLLLPLPASADGPAAVDELTAQAGDFLCRDLLTPLGRAVDEARADLRLPAERLPCHTLGTYSFSVPRRPLLQRVAQCLCDRLVRGWQVTTPSALEETIRSWVADQMTRWELTPECLARRLHEAWGAALGEAPEAFCDAAVRRWAKGGPDDLHRQPAAAREAVAEVDGLLAPPRPEDPDDAPSRLMLGLQEAARAVAEEAEKGLAEVALGVLMEPRFRLTGAEEAVRREIAAALTAVARAQKELAGQRGRQTLEVRRRMKPVLDTLGKGSLLVWGRKGRAADELVQLFGEYLAAGREEAVVQEVGRLYQQLEAGLHKYRLAIDCCHASIRQFLKGFAAPSAGEGAPADLGLGRYLLPAGSRTLAEAVNRVLASLTPEEEESLRQSVQGLIGSALQSHVHFCTAPPAHFTELREAIAREVAAVAETSLGRAHAAELYLEQHAEDAAVGADLAGAFAEAQPELAGPHGGEELCILAVPPGPEGEHFRSLAGRALTETTLLAAPSTDDIVFYREQPQVSLAELPQLGPAAREVYEQVLASEQPSPHSREDVTSWLPLAGSRG